MPLEPSISNPNPTKNYGNNSARKKILIAGASGFIGSHTTAFLEDLGHTVFTLARNDKKLSENEVFWDPAHNILKPEEIDGMDCILNFCGDNIASGRWSREKKARIIASRIQSTELICRVAAKLKKRPRLIVNASATGIYGNRGEEILDEESNPGTGFLAEVCRKWEDATQSAKDRGLRVVNLRTGVVLSPHGGMLKKILPAFTHCLGGKLGKGSQYMSFVCMEDLLSIINHLIVGDTLSGPVNAVSPFPVTNSEFTEVLSTVVERPALLNMPESLLRFIFGEMADEVMLAGRRVMPKRLLEDGFRFRFQKIEETLEYVLK